MSPFSVCVISDTKMAALVLNFQNSVEKSRFNPSLAAIIGSNLLIYSFSDGDLTVIDIPPYTAQDVEAHGSDQVQSQKLSGAEGSDNIVVCGFSRDGYLAICDDRKRLLLWQLDRTTWRLVSVRSLARRCTALAFAYACDAMVVSDKAGDVYKFSLVQPQQPGQLIKGHLSMMLDLFISADDRYVVTCDRDEKIHVSHYPNAYNIHTYCLGHTEFVSCLVDINDDGHFVSASGDGTIRLWNYGSGKLLQSVVCSDHVTQSADMTSQIDSQSGPLVVRSMAYDEKHSLLIACFHKKHMVQVYEFVSSELVLQSRTTLQCDSPVLDVCFDDSGGILTLQMSSELPLVVYKRHDRMTYQKLSADDSAIMTVFRSLPVSMPVDPNEEQATMLSKLYKTKVDNMKIYLSKKEERIKAKDKRPCKKLKT